MVARGRSQNAPAVWRFGFVNVGTASSTVRYLGGWVFACGEDSHDLRLIVGEGLAPPEKKRFNVKAGAPRRSPTNRGKCRERCNRNQRLPHRFSSQPPQANTVTPFSGWRFLLCCVSDLDVHGFCRGYNNPRACMGVALDRYLPGAVPCLQTKLCNLWIINISTALDCANWFPIPKYPLGRNYLSNQRNTHQARKTVG